LKAPMVLGGISCFVLLIILNFLENAAVTTVALFFLLGLFIILISFKKYIKSFLIFITACICCICCCFSFAVKQGFQYLPFEKLQDTKTEITGTVCSVPEEYDGYASYEIMTQYKGVKGKIKIYDYSEKTPSLNQSIKARVSFSQNEGKYRLDDKSKGIYARGTIYEYTLLKENADKSIYYYSARLRQHIKKSVEKYVDGKQKGIALSVSTGDKSMLGVVEENAFICTSLAHMNAVSGTHFVYITGFLFFVCCLIGFNPKITSILTVITGIFICFAANFTPSVIRAFIICAISALAVFFRREPFSINSLCLAVVIILMTNPFAAAGLSFTLSVLACFGMFACFSPLSNFVHAKLGYENKYILAIADMLCACISAILFTLPVSACNFGYISFTGLIANPLVVPFAAFLPVLVFCMSLLSFLPPVAFAFGFLVKCLCQYIFAVISILSRLEWGYLYADKPYIYIVAVSLIVLLMLCYLLKLKKLRKTGTLLISTFLCVCFVSNYYMVDFKSAVQNKAEITKIEGANSTVIAKGNAAVIVDGGGENAWEKITLQLENSGINKLKAIVISDIKSESYNALEGIIRYNRPEILVVPASEQPYPKKLEDLIILSISLGTDVIKADRDISLKALDGIKTDIFAKKTSKNSYSLLLTVESREKSLMISP